MPLAEWGTKRVCPTTGKRFYDLNRTPIVSPYTGEVVDIESARRKMAASVIARVKPEKDDEVLVDDLDNDDDVDQFDFDIFSGCATGPGVTPPASGCDIADMDRDEAVDQRNFGLSQRGVSGEAVPAAAEFVD